MMLIDLLDIATALDNKSQEAVYNMETGLFDLYQRAEAEDDPDHLVADLTFKELAMYATGMHASADIN